MPGRPQGRLAVLACTKASRPNLGAACSGLYTI